MLIDPEIARLVAELKKMKKGNAFKTFIDFMVFPRYRNIFPMERVDFDFPLTVFVGQNGSGKSAALQALYGAPGGYSVGRWWFETAVDPISEPTGLETNQRRSADLPGEKRSAFWYGYHYDGEDRQVLKTRIRRPADPDYWEPSRPIKRYGMTILKGEKRHETIRMEPVYVNFKLVVNAFDECFYFMPESVLSRFEKLAGWRHALTNDGASQRSARVQDYLRFKSRKLKRVLDEESALIASGRHSLNEPVQVLTPEELIHVNDIVGKAYIAGKVIKHRFFERWGTTVAFSTKDRSYTDAFAGSGEGAVVRLIVEVEKAKEGSLVLLDEPETSLHPGAQERMLKYLLTRCKEKKLQIAISTHSPTLVSHLPRESIKVFSLDASGLAKVIPDLAAEEAFHFIGHRYSASVNLIVEDRLAKEAVDEAIRSHGPAFAKRFSVSYGPGGDSAIKNDMVIYSRSNQKPIVLFDGDQKPQAVPDGIVHFDTRRIATGDFKPKFLEGLIKQQAGTSVQFSKDSNMAESEIVDLYRQYLDYYRDYVYYLPFPNPEQGIWDDEGCRDLLKVYDPNGYKAEAEAIIGVANYKRRFAKLAEVTQDVDAVHRIFVRRFKNINAGTWQELVALVKRIGDDHA